MSRKKQTQKATKYFKAWEDKFGKSRLTEKAPFKKAIFWIFLANFLVIILSLLANPFLPPEIPLFYGLPEGANQLASSWFLPFPSLASLLILIINLTLSSLTENEFLKKVLVLSGIIGVFYSLTTTVKIFFLVAGI